MNARARIAALSVAWTLIAALGPAQAQDHADAPHPAPPAQAAPQLDVIPAVADVEAAPGVLRLGSPIALYPATDEDTLRTCGLLAEQLNGDTGVRVEVLPQADPGAAPAGGISLALDAALAALGPEGYELAIGERGAALRAAQPAGLFRGSQTLRQLMRLEPPATGESAAPAWTLPHARIHDQPRFRWRGMMLDCARHFMPKELVKKYIDLLAYHRMNVFHWHLTDDQGWRLEIRKHPRLTEFGAWRGEGEQRDGGFYSQADVRDIVAYAAARYVTIVPEIEMPGHCVAALAAYPELSCAGGPFAVSSKWGVHDDVFCAGNEQTFALLEDVLAEVIELFPSKFIHVGGDEVPKTRWKACEKCQARIRERQLKDEDQLQGYFIGRIEAYLNARGRRLIGWDEILDGGSAPNVAVQVWRSADTTARAARLAHDVVASPTSHCYLDYAQGDFAGEPTSMGLITLETCYAFDPVPAGLNEGEQRRILGIQGNLWTEHAPPALVDRQAFPRLCALAEIGWSSAQGRDFATFQRRMRTHYRRLDALGVKYYVGPPRVVTPQAPFAEHLDVILEQPFDGGSIRYTTDGSEPGADAKLFEHALRITETTDLRARTFAPDGRSSGTVAARFEKAVPREAVLAGECVPGLVFAYYEGDWGQLPDFATLAPVAGGMAAAIDDSLRQRDDHFAMRFSGYLQAPVDGAYRFHIKCDDEARLAIGSEQPTLIAARWDRGEQSAIALLKAGKHPITLEFFQLGGPRELAITWEGPGLPRQALPGWALSSQKPAAEAALKAAAPPIPTALRPVPRTDDWWQQRFRELNERCAGERVDLIFLGDSITQGWEGDGKSVWEARYGSRHAINLGIGGDRTQHVLWRLQNGHLAALKARAGPAPKAVVVMIGTNNSNGNDHTAEQIAAGVEAIVKLLRAELPQTRVLLLGIFPRGEKPNEQRDKNAEANRIAARLADGDGVRYLDIGDRFLAEDGLLPREIMPDALHLSARGYEIWADAIEPAVADLLK